MSFEEMFPIYIAVLAVIVAIPVFYRVYNRKKVKDAITRLTSGIEEMPAEEFIAMRNAREGNRKISNQKDFTGIYIIHNVTKDKYYVGQSKNVLKRVTSHFGGSGNGDVYADLKYGDAFTVKTIPLADGGYANLDALERDTIQTYDAFTHGYNKNKGNKN